MDFATKSASAQQPAIVQPNAGPEAVSNSAALKITLCPTAADPDTPFLAQVFATDLSGAHGGEQLLGTVSFFPLTIGKAQNFVLPAPRQGFPPVSPQNVQLTVKLIPANSARSLSKATVEVVGAKFAE